MAEGERQRPCQGRHHHPAAAKGSPHPADDGQLLARQQEGKLPLDRQQATDLLKAQLALKAPALWRLRGFEPDGFDGQGQLRGTGSPWQRRQGRFVPLLPRQGSDRQRSAALHREERPDEFGNPANDYACPKREGRPASSTPSKVDISGQQVLVSTITTPILVGGRFRASPPLDLAVDSISRQAQSLNSNIYDGKGRP